MTLDLDPLPTPHRPDSASGPRPPWDPAAVLRAVFPGLALRSVAGARIPEPYRALLVHDQDMTSTLESFHGEPLSLEVLSRAREGDVLRRTVILAGDTTGLPRELGAIAIHLPRFAGPARDQVLASRRPLGAILGDHEIAYCSQPEEFLELQSTPEVAGALRVPTERLQDGPVLLYGRRNALRTPTGELLADVLEILPPVG